MLNDNININDSIYTIIIEESVFVPCTYYVLYTETPRAQYHCVCLVDTC